MRKEDIFLSIIGLKPFLSLDKNIQSWKKKIEKYFDWQRAHRKLCNCHENGRKETPGWRGAGFRAIRSLPYLFPSEIVDDGFKIMVFTNQKKVFNLFLILELSQFYWKDKPISAVFVTSMRLWPIHSLAWIFVSNLQTCAENKISWQRCAWRENWAQRSSLGFLEKSCIFVSTSETNWNNFLFSDAARNYFASYHQTYEIKATFLNWM